MMPTFELTANDGSKYQIDADSPDLAQKAFDHQFGTPQMEGWGRVPAMAGSYLAKGALTGAGAIGDLQEFLQRQVNKLADPIGEAITGRAAPAMPPPTLGSENLVGLGRTAGAVDRPDLQPQNAPERYLAAGAEGVGGMLPYLPLAAGNVVVNAGRAAVQGAAGGVGGEAAADLTGNNPWARAGGGLLGMAGATGLLGAGGRVANAVRGVTTPTVDAYHSLGIDPALAGDVTGSPFLQQLQTFAGKAPGGAGRIQAQSEKTLSQWGDAVEGTAANLGNARTAQQAGEALQDAGKTWLKDFRTNSDQAWNAVDTHVPQTTPTPVTNYATTLSDIRSSMPGAPATAEVLQPALSRQLLDSLTKDVQAGPLTWQDVRGIRTRIGEKLAEPQLVGDTSYTELRRLYAALSKDIEGVVATQGPAAQQAFTDASALTRSGHDFVDSTLSKVLRGDQITPERAADIALSSGGSGGTFLGNIRDQMPGAADELAAYKLRDMAAARAGQQTGNMTRVSPNAFLTDRANLSPEAHDVLFGDPYTASRVRDLSTVAGAMRGTERFLNTSNTATTGMMAHALNNLMGPLAAAGTYAGGGGLRNAAIAALAPWVTGQLAARATSTPALTGLLAAPKAAISPSSGLLAGGALYPWLPSAP